MVIVLAVRDCLHADQSYNSNVVTRLIKMVRSAKENEYDEKCFYFMIVS